MEYKIANGNTEAVISSLGGTVLSFKVDGKDILYPYTVDENGKARGGCPICAPWFGNESFGEKKHGFIRDTEANIIDATEDAIRLVFFHEGTEKYPWTLKYELIVSLLPCVLEISLRVKRIPDGVFSLAPVNLAFHPYFIADGRISSVQEGRNMYVSCFSETANTIPFSYPAVLINSGGNEIFMGIEGDIDARSRIVLWSDAVEKYVCVEPVLTDKTLLNKAEGLGFNDKPISLYMLLGVL